MQKSSIKQIRLKMKDYEQLYYDLLYKYKKALKKIEELEQELETLSNY